LIGDTQAWVSLVDRYGGNGLALKIVGETIIQVYAGDVGAFLADASPVMAPCSEGSAACLTRRPNDSRQWNGMS
jgi:hypothetical protein